MSQVCKDLLEEEKHLEQEVKDLFDKIDTDHSNEIDRKEFRAFARKIAAKNGKKVRIRETTERKEASPKISFVTSTYYKSTGLEKLTRKLEEYMDSCDKSNNFIEFI